jgi:hypothetical protein
MLVYDKFPDLAAAAAFGEAVLALDEDRQVTIATLPLDEPTTAYVPRGSAKEATLEQVTLVDYLFPFWLEPPIVYVSRIDDDEATSEDALAELAATFKGTFAGT